MTICLASSFQASFFSRIYQDMTENCLRHFVPQSINKYSKTFLIQYLIYLVMLQYFDVFFQSYHIALNSLGHSCHWVPQGKVCGLCGNYDGNSKNDFTTRSQETVADVLQFGNSWKASSSCPNAQLLTDPCASNRYRAAWSQKQCSIITSATFKSCHSKVW